MAYDYDSVSLLERELEKELSSYGGGSSMQAGYQGELDDYKRSKKHFKVVSLADKAEGLRNLGYYEEWSYVDYLKTSKSGWKLLDELHSMSRNGNFISDNLLKNCFNNFVSCCPFPTRNRYLDFQDHSTDLTKRIDYQRFFKHYAHVQRVTPFEHVDKYLMRLICEAQPQLREYDFSVDPSSLEVVLFDPTTMAIIGEELPYKRLPIDPLRLCNLEPVPEVSTTSEVFWERCDLSNGVALLCDFVRIETMESGVEALTDTYGRNLLHRFCNWYAYYLARVWKPQNLAGYDLKWLPQYAIHSLVTGGNDDSESYYLSRFRFMGIDSDGSDSTVFGANFVCLNNFLTSILNVPAVYYSENDSGLCREIQALLAHCVNNSRSTPHVSSAAEALVLKSNWMRICMENLPTTLELHTQAEAEKQAAKIRENEAVLRAQQQQQQQKQHQQVELPSSQQDLMAYLGAMLQQYSASRNLTHNLASTSNSFAPPANRTVPAINELERLLDSQAGPSSSYRCEDVIDLTVKDLSDGEISVSEGEIPEDSPKRMGFGIFGPTVPPSVPITPSVQSTSKKRKHDEVNQSEPSYLVELESNSRMSVSMDKDLLLDPKVNHPEKQIHKITSPPKSVVTKKTDRSYRKPVIDSVPNPNSLLSEIRKSKSSGLPNAYKDSSPSKKSKKAKKSKKSKKPTSDMELESISSQSAVSSTSSAAHGGITTDDHLYFEALGRRNLKQVNSSTDKQQHNNKKATRKSPPPRERSHERSKRSSSSKRSPSPSRWLSPRRARCTCITYEIVLDKLLSNFRSAFNKSLPGALSLLLPPKNYELREPDTVYSDAILDLGKMFFIEGLPKLPRSNAFEHTSDYVKRMKEESMKETGKPCLLDKRIVINDPAMYYYIGEMPKPLCKLCCRMAHEFPWTSDDHRKKHEHGLLQRVENIEQFGDRKHRALWKDLNKYRLREGAHLLMAYLFEFLVIKPKMDADTLPWLLRAFVKRFHQRCRSGGRTADDHWLKVDFVGFKHEWYPTMVFQKMRRFSSLNEPDMLYILRFSFIGVKLLVTYLNPLQGLHTFLTELLNQFVKLKKNSTSFQSCPEVRDMKKLISDLVIMINETLHCIPNDENLRMDLWLQRFREVDEPLARSSTVVKRADEACISVMQDIIFDICAAEDAVDFRNINDQAKRKLKIKQLEEAKAAEAAAAIYDSDSDDDDGFSMAPTKSSLVGTSLGKGPGKVADDLTSDSAYQQDDDSDIEVIEMEKSGENVDCLTLE